MAAFDSSRIREPQKAHVIGKGSFGTVSEGLDLETGHIVAIKKMSLVGLNPNDPSPVSDGEVQRIIQEIQLMKSLKHPNIVRYIGAARQDSTLSIYMEYIAGGSLADLLTKYGAMPESVAARYTRDMLMGMSYLHKKRIAHRDMKCDNLLLCSTGVVKVADFGCSKEFLENMTLRTGTLTGTPLFMAPEVALGNGYDPFMADIWTIGITVLQMLQGTPPYHGRFRNPHEAVVFVAMNDVVPPIPNEVSADGRDFLQRCLVRDPKRRCTLADLCQHPWITALDPASPLARTFSSSEGAVPPLQLQQSDIQQQQQHQLQQQQPHNDSLADPQQRPTSSSGSPPRLGVPLNVDHRLTNRSPIPGISPRGPSRPGSGDIFHRAGSRPSSAELTNGLHHHATFQRPGSGSLGTLQRQGVPPPSSSLHRPHHLQPMHQPQQQQPQDDF